MWRLQTLVEKVHWFHGDRHTGLARVNDLCTRAVTELDPRMTREERSVCPAISRMEKTGVRGTSGALAAHRNVGGDHTVVGNLSKDIDAVTGGYTTPRTGAARTGR
jgi:regulator of cell morphogenesis and NO signaling